MYGTKLGGEWVMNKPLLRKLRRKIVVAKYTMSRGYIWCQTPSLILITAGVMKPYLPGFKFYQIAGIGFMLFMTVGYIDKKFRFLNEEQSYATEQNTLLMKGLFKNNNERNI